MRRDKRLVADRFGRTETMPAERGVMIAGMRDACAKKVLGRASTQSKNKF